MKDEIILKKMLKILRIFNNKSIKDVGKEIGLGENVYGNYERGSRLPDIHTIRRIAKYYDVSVDFLMGITNEPNINAIPKDEYTMERQHVLVTILKNNYKLEYD